jgi:hypothetical protein
MPGHDGYTIRNAAYDLRKLRGKHIADKPGVFAVNAAWLSIAAMAHNLVRRRRAGSLPRRSGIVLFGAREILIRAERF